MSSKFVHLHVHTEYSLLDGLSNIKKLIQTVKEQGMDSVALTDHGVMYGAIEFYKAAKNEGIKPIVGMEAYTTIDDHRKKPQRGKSSNNHLLLLAKNEIGYKNLMKISSIAHLEGYYYRPRIQRSLLKNYSEGLIVTSACPAGELAQHIMNNDMESARKVAQWFLDIFGDDYYLEIQNHEYDKYIDPNSAVEIQEDQRNMAKNEKIITEGVVKLSRELGIPIVSTNDAHYVNKEDAEAQDVLVCVATGKQVSDTKRIRFVDTPSYYIKSPEEMAELFPDLPESLENTVKLADKIDLEISTLGKWFFPKFKVPEGKKAEDYLKEEARRRLKEKYEEVTNEIKERLEYELDIICQKGYAAYFLIVRDMVEWANKEGIITNTRGSAAGSLVSYVLGVTTVDPIKYYLPFERFLNPYRPSPPDIDFDVPDNKREEVIKYMVERYGEEKVAQICTFGRMLSRAAVRDVARVLGYPYEVGDKLAKLIPPPRQGFPIDIPRALKESAELKALYESDQDTKKILDLAQRIEGSARHISVHAAAIVVSPTDLTDFTPVQKEPSGEKKITQYEMHAAEDVGLIKFDILGIRNLAILADAIDIVEKRTNKKINIWEIPLDDEKTFDMLSRGETMGVFQLSSGGMTKHLMELKPERIEDLMAMVALYRPGPMAVIPEYIERKKNPEKIEYLDPRMEKFLDMSYGLIVYQDDLLFCAIDLAGYTWEEADKFRKAVGKKIPEEMAAQKKKFIEGIINNGQTKKFAEDLWELFEPFQSYGFNKAHAASYGMVAYQTAYMKANYPVEYMTALLTAEASDTEKISAAVTECRRMGIKVLPPDINKSAIGFTIEEDNDSLENKAIRFGLSAIKNVGEAAIEAILVERDVSEFANFADFMARVDSRKVNKRVVESLIKVGALSAFGNRATLISSYENVKNKVSKPKAAKGQQGLFGAEELIETAKVENSGTLLTYTDEFKEEELEILERQLLGFSLSAKPLEERLGELSMLATHKIGECNELPVKETVKIAGIVQEVRSVVTKRGGKEMAFVKIEDSTGSLDLVVFPGIYAETKSFWIESSGIVVTGKIDNRDDSLSLLVDEVDNKQSLQQKDRELFINIPRGSTKEQLNTLKNLLITNPGNNKVTLVFEENQEKLELKLKISWDKDLALQISEIFENTHDS